MKRLVAASVLIAAIALSVPKVAAFCGFYVAKADTRLFNRASQVVLVRDGDRTVLTMTSDYEGDPREFAMVVPVPTFLQRGQIHVADRGLVEHVDAFSAPRLVEYFDGDPCREAIADLMMRASPAAAAPKDEVRRRSLGVTIEASYTVGEYDILILSAQQSTGLETWLRENGYRIPPGAAAVIGSYLKQNMRFFVARVNLGEQARLGFSYLRPLQIAYESPKFMLPIRLGMVNANGPQELFIYTLTRRGRVETTNYRTVRMPRDIEVPAFLKAPSEFAAFYKALFSRQHQMQGERAVFLEHAWDTGWCDPCAADPLSADELRRLGVFWEQDGRRGGSAVFLTRLHVRYDGAHFPEDLVFQETADRSNLQGRYIVRHPWTGPAGCDAAAGYQRTVRERNEAEAVRLAELTGWTMADIRKKMGLSGAAPRPAVWWERLWQR